jgi:radical SAM superfamily enzyme YgiQ (UPF0313 family)
MNVVLVATYECGHQPFGLASPAAWLAETGAKVTCLDLTRDPLDEPSVRAADLVAFHVPMHTATRLAIEVVPEVQRINPGIEICFFGLYAPANAELLTGLGAVAVIGGEFEDELVRLVTEWGHHNRGTPVSLTRQRFLVPDRRGLPGLERYAQLQMTDGSTRVAGYTEASRGCRHRCRHCPVVPVYDGRFRIVQPDVVLADIDQQVAAGAQHITFGDPDFWNGVPHAVRIVQEMHHRHPDVTYDVTIKVEHILHHARHLPVLADTGCVFVTTAVESFDDEVLARLAKGHTAGDFGRALGLLRRHGLAVNPTFIPFHPWMTIHDYRAFLDRIAAYDLVASVAPIQLALRLLVPAGSLLLDLPEMAAVLGPFDAGQLVFPWRHHDPEVDVLQAAVLDAITDGEGDGRSRAEIFDTVWSLTGLGAPPAAGDPRGTTTGVPHLLEPWFCCAEPPAVKLSTTT